MGGGGGHEEGGFGSAGLECSWDSEVVRVEQAVCSEGGGKSFSRVWGQVQLRGM